MPYDTLHIGTCSWKYDSWQGLVYSRPNPANPLVEYSARYDTVEVDQWFWSLFKGPAAVLPRDEVVRQYAASVPAGFRFGIKVPNAITLTHHYKKHTGGRLVVNPHFLSIELMQGFLKTLEPLADKIGPLMFQFEYLNRQKMGGVAEFAERFGEFAASLPGDFTYCVEIRNPNYLNKTYFSFLAEHGLHHVFLQGYYMPSIFELYDTWREYVHGLGVIRLLGGEREDIEARTGKKWHEIVTPRDAELARLADMLRVLRAREVETYLYVNNHYEGSAPLTITRLQRQLEGKEGRG